MGLIFVLIDLWIIQRIKRVKVLYSLLEPNIQFGSATEAPVYLYSHPTTVILLSISYLYGGQRPRGIVWLEKVLVVCWNMGSTCVCLGVVGATVHYWTLSKPLTLTQHHFLSFPSNTRWKDTGNTTKYLPNYNYLRRATVPRKRRP